MLMTDCPVNSVRPARRACAPRYGSAQGIEPGVERDLPEVPVGILEVACVAAVKRRPCRLHDPGAGALRLTHERVHLRFGVDVVSQRELRGAGRLKRQTAVCGEAPP